MIRNFTYYGSKAVYSNQYSFTFDGVSKAINCGNFEELDNSQFCTISLWLKPNDLGSINRLTGKYRAAQFRLSVLQESNQITFVISNGVSVRGITTTSPITSTSAWYHICCVFDGTQSTNADKCKVYVNGVNQTLSFNGTIPTNIHDFKNSVQVPWWIGRSAGSGYTDGKIDEVNVMDYAFTPAQVTTLFNAGSPEDVTPFAPVHGWRMGEGATFTTQWSVPDEFGTNDGTSQNMLITDRTTDTP